MRDDDRLVSIGPAGRRLRAVPGQTASQDLQTTGLMVDEGVRVSAEPVLWFVTVTVHGPAARAHDVREALERLSAERPFVVSARYADDRAEVTYWDESDDVVVAASQALRMWADHAVSAHLPHWRVVGLEVLDRDTARLRRGRGGDPALRALGEIRPYEEG